MPLHLRLWHPGLRLDREVFTCLSGHWFMRFFITLSCHSSFSFDSEPIYIKELNGSPRKGEDCEHPDSGSILSVHHTFLRSIGDDLYMVLRVGF